MDFEDDMMPKNAPQPVSFTETSAKPSLPEVSLLFDQEKSSNAFNKGSNFKEPNFSKRQDNSFNEDITVTPSEPYNIWKWKKASHESSNRHINLPNTHPLQTPLKFDDELKTRSTLKNDYQQNFNPIHRIPTANVKNQHSYRPYSVEIDANSFDNCSVKLHGHNNFAKHDYGVEKNYVMHKNEPSPNIDFINYRPHTTLESNQCNMHFPSTNNYHYKSASTSINQHKRCHSNDNLFANSISHENTLRHERQSNVIDHCNLRAQNLLTGLGETHSHNVGCNHDILLNRCSNVYKHPQSQPHCCIGVNSPQAVKCDEQKDTDFIKDMLKIIQTQNEQILKLQNQINQLVQIHVSCHLINPHTDKLNPHVKNSQQDRNLQNDVSIFPQNTTREINSNGSSVEKLKKTPKDAIDENISTDIHDVKKSNLLKTCGNCECIRKSPTQETKEVSPKKCDDNIIQTSKNPFLSRQNRSVDPSHPIEDKSIVDKSFTLNEADLVINTVAEQIPSPTSSVHVDMQDYNSSSYDNSSDSSSEEESSKEPQVGWTFYNNVVGQVNNILHKKSHHMKTPDTFDAVRNATMEHLRRLGISFNDVDNTISKKVTFGASNEKNETDITMHFNALAMECLNEDRGIRNNSNLSYATLHYLERYHLLPKNQDTMFQQQTASVPPIEKIRKQKKKKETYHKLPQQTKSKKKSASKILDITTLKQQPKLL
uniref:Uncharacterized protein n=1 Tax=Clastoptera arizonana TaxID=38151 RepID=A0A1B6D0T9_9HEMI